MARQGKADTIHEVKTKTEINEKLQTSINKIVESGIKINTRWDN